VLHLDSDWTKNLEYFLELPAGKVAIELDGTTDIFKAHQVLRGHTCIIGDVGAPLFTIGTPQQISDYCQKLLHELGRDGGFILGSGCHIPLQAKHENVDAFFHSIQSQSPQSPAITGTVLVMGPGTKSIGGTNQGDGSGDWSRYKVLPSPVAIMGMGATKPGWET
ncbi:MAG: uroporphyrinogen decarboxylase family protein, partial [Syntrophaceticus sp.]